MRQHRNHTEAGVTLLSGPEPNQGVYVLRIGLPAPLSLKAGALPEQAFAPGTYWYVGSAQRHLRGRLSRHLKSAKPLRWHIDYLLARPEAWVEAVFTKPADKSGECDTAQRLIHYGEPVPRFGASDCRCSTHLIHTRGPYSRAAEALLLEHGFVLSSASDKKTPDGPQREARS